MNRLYAYGAAFISLILGAISFIRIGRHKEKGDQLQDKLDDHEEAMTEFKNKEEEANEKRAKVYDRIAKRNFFRLRNK